MFLVIFCVERKQSETKRTWYYGYKIRSVSLLQIRKQRTLPAVTQILQHTSAFWQEGLPIRLVLNRSHELNRRWILSVLSRWQNRNTNRTCVVLGKKLLYSLAGASCKTLFFQCISDFQTCLHLARLLKYPKANRPKYNERSAKLQRCQ